MSIPTEYILRRLAVAVAGWVLVWIVGCGETHPKASLPAAPTNAVAALEALKAKTAIRDGKVVYVDFYGVADAASAAIHLKDLPDVQKLNFSGTNMTDAALVHLANLSDLKELALNGTRITDRGIVYLAGLIKLERLNLNENDVSDAGLIHLKNLKELKHLHLNGTKVSDAGLVHLDSLETLEWLLVYRTSVTANGAAPFREHHPNTQVVTNEGDSVTDPASDND
jgi:hypothetical protein